MPRMLLSIFTVCIQISLVFVFAFCRLDYQPELCFYLSWDYIVGFITIFKFSNAYQKILS